MKLPAGLSDSPTGVEPDETAHRPENISKHQYNGGQAPSRRACPLSFHASSMARAGTGRPSRRFRSVTGQPEFVVSALKQHFGSPRVRSGILLVIAPVAGVAGIVLAVSYWGHEVPGALGPHRSKPRKRLARAILILITPRRHGPSAPVSLIKSGSPREAEALTIKGQALAALEETGPARQMLERAGRCPSGDAAKVLAAIYLSANENSAAFRC